MSTTYYQYSLLFFSVFVEHDEHTRVQQMGGFRSVTVVRRNNFVSQVSCQYNFGNTVFGDSHLLILPPKTTVYNQISSRLMSVRRKIFNNRSSEILSQHVDTRHVDVPTLHVLQEVTRHVQHCTRAGKQSEIFHGQSRLRILRRQEHARNQIRAL